MHQSCRAWRTDSVAAMAMLAEEWYLTGASQLPVHLQSHQQTKPSMIIIHSVSTCGVSRSRVLLEDELRTVCRSIMRVGAQRATKVEGLLKAMHGLDMVVAILRGDGCAAGAVLQQLCSCISA